jgi:hypothetical protein
MRVLVLVFSLFAVSAFGREVIGLSKTSHQKAVSAPKAPKPHKMVQAPRAHHRG